NLVRQHRNFALDPTQAAQVCNRLVEAATAERYQAMPPRIGDGSQRSMVPPPRQLMGVPCKRLRIALSQNVRQQRWQVHGSLGGTGVSAREGQRSWPFYPGHDRRNKQIDETVHSAGEVGHVVRQRIMQAGRRLEDDTWAGR